MAQNPVCTKQLAKGSPYNAMANEGMPLTLRPTESLQVVGLAGQRIVAEMMHEALKSVRHAQEQPTEKLRTWDHERREPDFRQILVWAKALRLEPETVVARLLGLSSLSGAVPNSTDGWDTKFE